MYVNVCAIVIAIQHNLLRSFHIEIHGIISVYRSYPLQTKDTDNYIHAAYRLTGSWPNNAPIPMQMIWTY